MDFYNLFGGICMIKLVMVKDLKEWFNLELICLEMGFEWLILISDLFWLGLEFIGFFFYYLEDCV